MGFYLSSREGINFNEDAMQEWQICLMGPRGLKQMIDASSFGADYFQNVDIIEFPDNLEQSNQEETKA